jgi:hypothetical protein
MSLKSRDWYKTKLHGIKRALILPFIPPCSCVPHTGTGYPSEKSHKSVINNVQAKALLYQGSLGF